MPTAQMPTLHKHRQLLSIFDLSSDKHPSHALQFSRNLVHVNQLLEEPGVAHLRTKLISSLCSRAMIGASPPAEQTHSAASSDRASREMALIAPFLLAMTYKRT